VVEGHGDIEALPIIVRRIAEQNVPPIVVRFPAVIRTPKSKLIKQGELERAVELAARSTSGQGGVLVVLDGDDDCPAEVGPALLSRGNKVRADIPLALVIAQREFESWFIAAAESIAGVAGLPLDLQPPDHPEDIRGAKEWLTERMEGSRRYSPTLDQPALARLFDLNQALRVDSFHKFYREAQRLLNEIPETV
jgi:sirohydrochlorin ferrochelatase